MDQRITPKICIVGAGFSGLCMGAKLKQELNLNTFTIYEACPEVGGTWYVNTYPGCACDVPSHLYSLSFYPKYDWSHSYSPQPEILEYAKDVARQFNLYPHIRFQTRVETLRWDEKEMKWNATILYTQTKRILHEQFDIVINGTGKIRIPHYPKEYLHFKGPIIHSAEWDHSVRWEGKRVGVIGTGASAVQIITTIADKVENLTVFQRKAPYIIPRLQVEYPAVANWAFANIPGLYRFSRYWIFWAYESMFPATRFNSLYSRLLEKGTRFFRNFQISDPELREKATPPYKFACKRVILSENYYTTLAKPNVDLITSKIDTVSGTTIQTADGNAIELDVLILATGYQPHDFFSPMRVYGTDGLDILAEWKKDRPKGYMGIVSHDTPNFFSLLGPYTAIGHNSNIFNIECQVAWTISAIKDMMLKGASSLILKRKVENEFMKYVDDVFGDTVWGNDTCGSWYLDEKGQNTTLWPNHQIEFWNRCRHYDSEMFEYQ